MLKLMIGAKSRRLRYFTGLTRSLARFGVECTVIDDRDYDVYPGTSFKSWIGYKRRFRKIVQKYKPDIIMADRVKGFALNSVNSGIPTLVFFRGNHWYEYEMARKTTHKSFVKRWALEKRNRDVCKILSKATMILPVCNHLEKIVNEQQPGMSTRVWQNFIDVSEWFKTEPMELEHPCVGLLQDARLWAKAQEMLLLKEILPRMPDVMFYWMGGGRLVKTILVELEKFPNFKWLGTTERSDVVKKYLAGINVYALISGIDMSPSSLLEAQLMERPVLATDVGGVSELVNDVKCLVPVGDVDGWVKRIRDSLNSQDVGDAGMQFVRDNFGTHARAKELAEIIRDVLKR